MKIQIWNDAQDEPPRKLYGFYSQDSLEYLHFQKANREFLTRIRSDARIAGRMYQIEAIKRVSERFSDRHRKALIVQAGIDYPEYVVILGQERRP